MEKLGINSTMIIVQIINFTLLFFILKKYLAKPIVSIIKQREKDIVDIESEKANLEKLKLKADEEYKKVLADAQKQADEILSEARQRAEEEKSEILNKANAQAKKIVSKAELQKKIKK